MAESAAIEYAKAAVGFYDGDAIAPAILDDLHGDATYDEFLEAAIGQMRAGSERAEELLWGIGEVTPWAKGALRAANRLGYEVRMEEDVFDALGR